MSTILVRRVVLIADALLESQLLDMTEQSGLVAQSSIDCSDTRSRGVADDVLSRGRVRIEALGSDDNAREFIEFLSEGLMRRHSIISYIDTVEMDERSVPSLPLG